MRRGAWLAIVGLLVLAAPASAQQSGGYATAEGASQPIYPDSTVEEFRIPTPYGQLYGWVRRPVVPAGVKVPVILTYSPYHLLESQVPGEEPTEGLTGVTAPTGVMGYFVPRGYARAWVHLVGTGKSEGCYDFGGPRDIATGPMVVEWLASQPWSNGRVAMIGGSYDGTTQWATAIEAPPALKVIVPQVAIARWYDYEFVGGVPRSQPDYGTPFLFNAVFNFGVPDPESSPALLDSVRPCETLQIEQHSRDADPVYDGFWDARDYTSGTQRIRASVLIEGSWADSNVLPTQSLRMWRDLPAGILKHFVMAQQGHGASPLPDAMDIRHAWFDQELLGIHTGVESLPAADSVDGATKKRSQSAAWPPPATRVARLVAATGAGFGALGLDGAQPSWQDLNPQLAEGDVLAGRGGPAATLFVGAAAARDVRLVDEPHLDLALKTDRESTHVQAVLFDQAADGTRVAITRGALNSRTYKSERSSDALVPGRPWRARFPLLPTDWILEKEHRLGLALMSVNTAVGPRGDDTRLATNELLLADAPALDIAAATGAETLGPLLPVVASPTGGAAPGPIAAARRPASRIRDRIRITRRTVVVRGTASGTAVRRVDVSISRLGGGVRCRALTRRGRLGRSTRRCTRWLRARGTVHWSLSLRARLPAGTYLVRSRARNAVAVESGRTVDNARIVVVR